MPNLSSFVCFALLATAVFSYEKRCVTLFESNPEYFDLCRATECIIFRTEIPFVWVPKTMNSTEHQKPFPCSDYKRFEGLKGPFFDIINASDGLRNTQCVWGGAACQFDDMVHFVLRSTCAGAYKFVAGGLLFMLKYRMTNDTIASVPFLDDRIVIIGPRDQNFTFFTKPWATISGPLSRGALALILLNAICAVIMRVGIAYSFTMPWTWPKFCGNLLGDYVEQGRGRVPRQRDPPEMRRLKKYLSSGSMIVSVSVLMWYEITMVEFMFPAHRESVKLLGPRQFVIVSNTTQDRTFKDYIKRKQFGNCPNGNEACWKQVNTTAEVYDTIMRPGGKSNRYRYSIVYETLNQYWFEKNSSFRRELKVLDYAPLNRRFMGVWYYSSNIPQVQRLEMDKAMTELREKEKTQRLIHDVIRSKFPEKGAKNDSIYGLPLFGLAILSGIVIFFTLILFTRLYTI